MVNLLPHLGLTLTLHQTGSCVQGISLNTPRRIIFPRDGGDGGDSGDDGDDPSNSSNGNGNGDNKSSTSIAATTTFSDKHDSTTTSFISISSTSTVLTSSGSSTKSTTTDSNSSSNTSSALSASSRAGIAFGILFGAIALVLLFCYCRRRARKARERVASDTALPLSSEVQRYMPPISASATPLPSSQQDIALLPHLNTNGMQSLASHSVHESPGAAADIASMTRDPGAASVWQRSSTLPPLDAQVPVITADVHLPNPHDPFPAPARVASLASTSAASPSASVSIVPERRASVLHTDLLLYQKQLEIEHRKESLEPHVEPLDPPPSYAS